MSLGTVAGSTVQCASWLSVAQTPNWKSCGVDWKPRAWSVLKPSCPVRTTVKVQPLVGWPSEAFGTRNVMKREIGFAADGHCAERRAGGVLIALAEALDLDKPAPRVRRRNSEVPALIGGLGRGRPGTGDVDVHVDELRPQRAPECLAQVSRLEPEDNLRIGVVDLESLDVEGAVVEVVRRRVGVIAWTVVIAVGVADLEDERARHEIEQDRSLLLGGAARWAHRDDLITLVPPVTSTSMLNEPSAAAMVDAIVVAVLASVLVAAT